MQYVVKLKPSAEKELEKLPKKIRDKVLHALTGIAENPFTGKKLEGEFAGHYSVRVWPYRIIYRIRKSELVVIVIRIGHRQGVY